MKKKISVIAGAAVLTLLIIALIGCNTDESMAPTSASNVSAVAMLNLVQVGHRGPCEFAAYVQNATENEPGFFEVILPGEGVYTIWYTTETGGPFSVTVTVTDCHLDGRIFIGLPAGTDALKDVWIDSTYLLKNGVVNTNDGVKELDPKAACMPETIPVYGEDSNGNTTIDMVQKCEYDE